MSERLASWVGDLCAKAAWCAGARNHRHAERFLDEAVRAIMRYEGAHVVFASGVEQRAAGVATVLSTGIASNCDIT